jgi:hypothetical protein
MSHFKIKDLRERWSEIVAMAYAGKSAREIAEAVGMSAAHIRREVRRLDFSQDFEDTPPIRHERFYMSVHRDTRITLGKMFGMLGSDHDGEVLAAVSAIKRRMDLCKVTFGDLANMIAGENVSERIIYVERDSPLAEMAEVILENGRDALSPREKQFVEQMLSRFQVNPDFSMSDKQTNWFTSLHSRFVANRFDRDLS